MNSQCIRKSTARFFYMQHFDKQNARLKLAKNQANTKQHP